MVRLFLRRDSQVVRHGSAKPVTAVQFRFAPPSLLQACIDFPLILLTFIQMAGKGIKRNDFALKYDTNRIHFSRGYVWLSFHGHFARRQGAFKPEICHVLGQD